MYLEDEHGFESQEEAFYRIAMMPDKPPVVRVLEPIRKEKLTQRDALQSWFLWRAITAWTISC